MHIRRPYVFLVAAAALVGLCFALGPTGRTVAYPLLGLICTAAIVFGIWHHRVPQPRAWASFAVAVALFAAGDLVHLVPGSASPAVGHVLYLAAYPFLMMGLLLLAHRPSVGVAIDAAIVGACLFVLGWTLLESWHGRGDVHSHWETFVATSLPVLSLLLVFFVAHYFFAVRSVSRAAILAAVGIAALLAGDLAYAAHLSGDGSGGPGWGGLFWLAAYAFWAAAALDDGRGAGPAPRSPRTRLNPIRLAPLAVAVLVANGALLLTNGQHDSRIVLVLGATAVSLLALGRAWELMRGNARLLAAQRLSEQRFRETLENVALVAVSLDERGVVTFANDFLLDLTGWKREDVVGRDWFERFDGDEDVRRDYFECMERGEIRPHFESSVRRRDGELRTIRWSSTLLRDGGGAVAGIVTLGEDVTERRDAEEELRRREEHFRSLIENATDVVCVLSLDGVSLYESPAVERVLGWQPEELIGRRNFNLHHPDDAERVRTAFDAVLAGEHVAPIKCRLRHKDGSWRDTETTAHLRVRDGEQVLVLNYRDVSERRELEEKLLHAQKLEAIGRLAGGVAHDFNNLLTAIGGYAELLLAGLDPDDPLRGDAQEIARASSRAAALTSQLLAFSRRQVLRPEVLEAGDVIGELENLLSRLLSANVEMTTSFEPGCFVEADRGQLEQVITNLVVNARDAMPRGGSLAIETRRIERDGAWVEIAVSDTGCGMGDETLEHLFEPFFTTKEKGKGTGLGLATVHGIVKQSGGDVFVSSELDAGSTFRVLLPLAESAPIPRPVPRVAQPAGGAETILLVEDEEMIRRLVRDVLVGNGYNVLEAPAGEPALELLRGHDGEIDLLLTDVVMPGLSGPALAAIVVEERPGVRVLFMSGYTSEPEEVVGAPDTAFLAKPFAPRDLVAKVRDVLEAVPA